jgi:hypothetical protein
LLVNGDSVNTASVNTTGSGLRARAWTRVTVFATGKAIAHSRINVLATAEMANRRARAWSKISVYGIGKAIAYSELGVEPMLVRRGHGPASWLLASEIYGALASSWLESISHSG